MPTWLRARPTKGSFGPARMADSRASHFGLACRREVSVERERLTKSSSSHDLKAHCVEEQVHTFVVPTQPAPTLVFDVWVHMDHSHPWGLLRCIEKACGCLAPSPSAQESPGFPDDVIAAQQQTPALRRILFMVKRPRLEEAPRPTGGSP